MKQRVAQMVWKANQFNEGQKNENLIWSDHQKKRNNRKNKRRISCGTKHKTYALYYTATCQNNY